MATQLNPGAARPVPAFDPAAWLGALVSIGGGYALASGRKLWLVVEECATVDIEDLMRPLIGHPDRVEAVRSAIERRQNGGTL
ncbi:hypothetical protein C8J46_105433 [Sphingomonas sp. PP-F2F-A104-K0414]|uniref:hypothetical protein n=1 Tax=Sphingomonas sp. PP-F2F-A104-K0414 TaxID=2135661 RepID=UPI00104FC1DC|nr:hypothetical protein [Sphingomonas sp. PP-F2F-A104-K0414]TCP98277.1 hypothetical protein C8J46_105433 [Sphingomonas sp. PP-F2F-A104-K0414]